MSRGTVRDTKKVTGSANYRSGWGQGDIGEDNRKNKLESLEG